MRFTPVPSTFAVPCIVCKRPVEPIPVAATERLG